METCFQFKKGLNKYSLLFLVLLSFQGISQQTINQHIIWLQPIEIETDAGAITVPHIKGQELSGYCPNYSWLGEVKSSQLNNGDVVVTSTIPALNEEILYLNNHNIQVDTLSYTLRISNAREKKVAVMDLFPFMKVNGEIHRITDFTIQLNKSFSHIAPQPKSFVANSVLKDGSGFWYKISVSEDGIYKIDYPFLESCLEGSGIDISTISPDDINIYGNGEGKLPELNSTYRTDDLAKNAIQVIDGGDGTFDQGDYILFYGWGPHRWYLNSIDEFDQNRHVYSDVACYFININSAETPLRMASLSESVQSPTHTITKYDFRDIHEADNVSLVSGGQRWYGELFDGGDLVRNFTFRVPNVDLTDSAYFRVAMASNANTAAGNTQTYSINGATLGQWSLPVASADYGRTVQLVTEPSPAALMPLKITVQRNSPDVLTYLDRIVLNTRANLIFEDGQLNFRDNSTVGLGNVGVFKIQDLPSSGGYVWDVTDKHEPKIIEGQFLGTEFQFVQEIDSLREFIACDGLTYLTPAKVGTVDYQNLHGLPQADYIIVSHKLFLAQAERLANLHRDNGLIVHVVDPEMIYNEFSSGVPDATAIKFFAKMFYDRGAIDPTNRIKHLLLFGDGTFDPKNRVANNNNFVLAYEVVNSESHISATVADDYYGMLDDIDGNQSGDLMDISVGRLLISDNQMAKEQVDKIEHYMRNGSNLYSANQGNCCTETSNSTFGDWRTRYVQVADDEEGGYFVRTDSEPHYEYVKDSFPDMNSVKIYLDAYQQTTTAGGQRYPEVVERIDEEMNRGSLVFCYVGHGGEVGVAEERVITVPQIQSWTNINSMPLMVSATCEFTKFDDPSRVSAGEWASINPLGGAIALMTSTRSIYFGTNSQITMSFYENVFRRDSEFKPRTFGEIITDSKNAVGGTNKRSFTLIGDPALRIALPYMKIVTDSINGYDPSLVVDTLKALSKVTVKGHMEDFYGNVLSSYNGVLSPTVFDKPKIQETLVNDPTSSLEVFELQNSKLYRGKASIVNGYFEFSFIVPKDINYAVDTAKISYYSEDGATDGIGHERRVLVGGIDPNGLNDNQGPDIELYMNDESFVNGGTTDETPVLLVKAFDESGINSSGSGIGHDLIAVLDANTGDPIVLNDYYTAELDSYQSGEIRYQFMELEPGAHTLTVKVWDVNNNSSEASIDFVVQEHEEIALDHVLNYPNPFTTYTEFFFEHNQVCTELETQVQIFTVSGRLVKTINTPVQTEGFRSAGIPWDGRDDFGDQLAKGVYVYRLKVKAVDGTVADETEKLVILR